MTAPAAPPVPSTGAVAPTRIEPSAEQVLALLERALRYAITHQHAFARLAESEQRHALAMQGANDGLWDWDVRADKLYFSPRWKAMIGYPEAEIGDLIVEVRSATAGVGSYTARFDHMAELIGRPADQIVAARKAAA